MPRPRAERHSKPADYLEPLVRALADPGTLAGIRVTELHTVAYQLALYYGLRRGPATASVLAGVYERLRQDGTGEDRRTLVEELGAAVRGGATTVLALLPVLQHERDASLVRVAAFTLATRLAGEPGDALAGPRAVRTLLDHADEPGVRAGLVGALLALGDRRVAPFVHGTWQLLVAAGRRSLLELPRERATRLELEWMLGWLEDADPTGFVEVAGSLAAMADGGRAQLVDVERELPATAEPDVLVVLTTWSARETGEWLAPRLRDLARRAAHRGALEDVRLAWGAPS